MKVFVVLSFVLSLSYGVYSDLTEDAINSTQQLLDVIAKNPEANPSEILSLNELLNFARSLARGEDSAPPGFRADQAAACENLKNQIEQLKDDVAASKASEATLALQLKTVKALVSTLMIFTKPTPQKIQAALKGVQAAAEAAAKLNAAKLVEDKALKALAEATESLAKLECDSISTTTVSPQRLSRPDCTRTADLYSPRGKLLKSMCWINETIDYDGAEDACRSKGMNLFAIIRADENVAFRAACEENIEANEVWINGKQSEDGTWWTYIPDERKLLEEVWPTRSYSKWNGFLFYSNYEGPFTTIGGFKQATRTYVCEFGKVRQEEYEETTEEEEPSFVHVTFGEDETTTASMSQRCPGCLPLINFCALPGSSDCTCVAGKLRVKCPILGPYCCK